MSSGALIWTIHLRNHSDSILEFGDLALPLPFNQYWPNSQTAIYEERVLRHALVANGHRLPERILVAEQLAGSRPVQHGDRHIRRHVGWGELASTEEGSLQRREVAVRHRVDDRQESVLVLGRAHPAGDTRAPAAPRSARVAKRHRPPGRHLAVTRKGRDDGH